MREVQFFFMSRFFRILSGEKRFNGCVLHFLEWIVKIKLYWYFGVIWNGEKCCWLIDSNESLNMRFEWYIKIWGFEKKNFSFISIMKNAWQIYNYFDSKLRFWCWVVVINKKKGSFFFGNILLNHTFLRRIKRTRIILRKFHAIFHYKVIWVNYYT